jgi:erythromycin esterase-like protein
MVGVASFAFALSGQLTEFTKLELLGGGPGKPKRVIDYAPDSYMRRLFSPPVQIVLDELEPEIAEVIVAEAAQVVQEVTKPSNEKRTQEALEALGFAYQQAYKQIFIELVAEMRQAQEDEQIAQIIAALI